MASRLSLKDQLAQLNEPAPIDLDPEDALAGLDTSEHRLAIDHSAAREHYTDVAPSSLRKLHESVSDPKYDAIRTSRTKLYEESEGEREDEDEDEDEVMEEDFVNERDKDSSKGGSEQDEESHSSIEDGDLSGPDSDSDSNTPQSRTAPTRNQLNEASAALSRIDLGGPVPRATSPDDPQAEGDIATNLRLSHEVDKKKGRAVSRQIALWDTLLDARIQLHKAVTAANRLPLPDEAVKYASHPDVHEALDSLLDVASGLTEELFSLQEHVLQLNETIEAPARKRRKLEASSDPVHEYGSALEDLSASASVLEASYHPWLVGTLSKWSAKVQAVAPNVLLPDKRGSFMRDGKPFQVGVLSMIDELFHSDGTKLLDRTRKRKDKHSRIGQSRTEDEGEEEDRVDVEVFDDTDYYQQLLRDVIATRGGSDGQGGEQQWQMEQRERKAKRKKTVDTKASKGRKLRYEVHAKLQNFMVPVPVVGCEWHEEQIDGLFSSLLQS